MDTRDRIPAAPDRIGTGNETGAAPAHEAGEDCRCKEASKMTPRQLLDMMMRDLAFWKKTKKT